MVASIEIIAIFLPLPKPKPVVENAHVATKTTWLVGGPYTPDRPELEALDHLYSLMKKNP